MLDASRRPNGRLFYWLLAVIVAALPRALALPTSPALTTVSDTVFMADECLNASTWAKQPMASGTPTLVSK